MGATKSNTQATKSGKRGSVDNAKRLAALNQPEKTTAGADWSTADPRWLAACVARICASGGGILLGYSRDQGAYRVIVYMGDDMAKLWWNGDCDLNHELESLFTWAEGLE